MKDGQSKYNNNKKKWKAEKVVKKCHQSPRRKWGTRFGENALSQTKKKEFKKQRNREKRKMLKSGLRLNMKLGDVEEKLTKSAPWSDQLKEE